MVHRSSDTRLLNNLISHEKDYSKHLTALLDSSHASCNSLTVFAASSPPPASQLILAIAGSLHGVDDALRGYAAAVERWRQYLAELKDLEDEVGNIIRDREILVTRLLKVSTKSKPPSNNRDSIMSFSHQSSSTLDDPPSMTYLPNSPELTFTAPNKKVQVAQAELQACEAHLAIKERELDLKRSIAVREGLQTRFRALAECGSRWAQIGKDVGIRLFGSQNSITTPGSPPPAPQPIFSPESKPLPMPDMPDLPLIHTPTPIRPGPPTGPPLSLSPTPDSEVSHASSSIAPSQSASQVGTITPHGPGHIYSNLEAQPSLIANGGFPVIASAPVSPTPESPAPVPPLKRHTLPHRITEEDLRLEASSDDDGEEPMRVVENPRYQKGPPSREASSSSSPKKDKGGGGLFGSIRGLFHRHARESSFSSTGKDEDQDRDVGSSPVGRGRGKRIALFGGGGGGGKKNSNRWDGDESPVRPGLPARRVSEDIVPTVFPPVRGRVMSMSDVGPLNGNSSGKRLKKKTGGGEASPVKEQARGNQKKKTKRRRSASLDPGVLREQDENEEDDIVDLGKRDRQDSLVRAEEWVDSQKRQEVPETPDTPGTPTRKTSVKKNRKQLTGIEPSLSRAASASTPDFPLPESWAVVDRITIVPVESGGLSRSGSTRSRTQSTAATSTASKHSRQRRSSSTEPISTSSTMPAISSTATMPTTTRTQRRSSSPVTFGVGSTSLMSIVEDVARANREAWNASGSGSGVVKSVGGTVQPAALVDVKAPRRLSAKDLEVVNIAPTSNELKSSSSLFLPKAPTTPKENGSVKSLPLPTTKRAITPAPPKQQQPTNHQRAVSIPNAQKKPIPPLRSALKGASRTPSPMPPVADQPQPSASTSRLPEAPPVEGLPVTTNGKDKGKDGDDSDADSISSYETGHEIPVPADAPPVPTISPPSPVVPTTSPRASSPLPPPVPNKQNGLSIPVSASDLSASSSSTVHQGEGGGTKRRKSVRVSLKPQFSPTPPAVDDGPEPSWYDEQGGGDRGHELQQEQEQQQSVGVRKKKRYNKDHERDMWVDSSEDEEDGEYASARRLLMKGLLKGKKERG